jgi:hypothetical protein
LAWRLYFAREIARRELVDVERKAIDVSTIDDVFGAVLPSRTQCAFPSLAASCLLNQHLVSAVGGLSA